MNSPDLDREYELPFYQDLAEEKNGVDMTEKMNSVRCKQLLFDITF